MSQNVPTTAAVLTLVGGIFVLLVGLALAALGSILSFFIGGLAGLFFIGLILGILIIIFAILLFVKPEMRKIWGILIILMAILTLPFDLGGAGIGFILSLIGGILAITYKPPIMMGQPMMGQPMMGQPMPPPPPGTAPGVWTCPACGGAVNPQNRTCMSCGKTV